MSLHVPAQVSAASQVKGLKVRLISKTECKLLVLEISVQSAKRALDVHAISRFTGSISAALSAAVLYSTQHVHDVMHHADGRAAHAG